MNTTVNPNKDVQNRGAGGTTSLTPPNVGPTSSVLPEAFAIENGESSHTGVSTRNALDTSIKYKPYTIKPGQHWYVIRTAHGKEQDGSELMEKNGIEAFYPIITTVKTVEGKKKITNESRIPNIFFAYGDYDTIMDIIKYSRDKVAQYLHFYCFHHLDNTVEPITVPDNQMKSLKIICGALSEDILVKSEVLEKFKEGTRVLVTEGDFKGVEGIVTRFWGQQRVGFVIDNIGTAATAYVPSAFLKPIDNK